MKIRSGTYSFKRCLSFFLLPLYLMMTVGVGVHVCSCCGSVKLVPLWKPVSVEGISGNNGNDGAASCCSTEVYVLDEEFCLKTGHDSSIDVPDIVAFAVQNCSIGIFRDRLLPAPCFRDGFHEALPPGRILPFISRFRL